MRRDNRETQRVGEELINEFLKKNGFEPSIADVAKQMNLPEDKIRKVEESEEEK